MIKIIIRENKNLIKEMSTEQALQVLRSKASEKLFYKTLVSSYEGEVPSQEILAKKMGVLWLKALVVVENLVPKDIDENKKALSIIWLKNVLFKQEGFIYSLSTYETIKGAGSITDSLSNYSTALEMFFQMNRFIEQKYKDINAVPDYKTLSQVLEDAKPKYYAYLEKQKNLDADKGTEIIYEDDKWKIFIPHNKGAACELGKGTDWCTAAPGLD